MFEFRVQKHLVICLKLLLNLLFYTLITLYLSIFFYNILNCSKPDARVVMILYAKEEGKLKQGDRRKDKETEERTRHLAGKTG